MNTTTKTIEIISKGRKYFAAKLGGKFPCKLDINSVTRDFAAGMTVTVDVIDRSSRSRYGSDIRFEAVGVVTNADLEERTALRQAEYWLGLAEQDARRGLTRTRAIGEALDRGGKHEVLASRVTALKSQVEATLAAAAARSQLPLHTTQKNKNYDARFPFLLDACPAVGTEVEVYGGKYTVKGLGKAFRMSDDMPSMYGHTLLGHEGEWVRYAYLVA